MNKRGKPLSETSEIAGENGGVAGEKRGTPTEKVSMVATPGDGSCGIGTYARDLQNAFKQIRTEHVDIDQDQRTVGRILSLAVRAMMSDSDVVHIQHEYGLFRRKGSPYPGVMGLVLFPALVLLNLLQRKTLIVTLHSVINPEPGEKPRRIRYYLYIMHGLIARSADHLIFLSEECQRDFRRDISLRDDAYSVLPHGVNVSDASDKSQAEAKTQFGFDPDDTVVVIPGFVRPPKGHDIFVEVASQLPQYEFFIAGGARPKGEDADFARKIAETADSNVTISGVLDDDVFPTALNAADLAFLPYRVVTQSGTFNWCVAHELPVLASDVPYFERIRHRWGNVETIDIGDRDEIVDRIQELLDSPERLSKLQRNSRRYKRANSFENIAALHRQIYAGERADVPTVADESPEARSSSPRGRSSTVNTGSDD
jgi:glycosyltransferase involved in cell wall biosynthesis